MAQERLTLHYT